MHIHSKMKLQSNDKKQLNSVHIDVTFSLQLDISFKGIKLIPVH